MKKNFDSSLKFIEHLASLYGGIVFGFDTTPYGKEFYWRTDINNSDSLEKLESNLCDFDDVYHDEFELERGGSREYVFDRFGFCDVIYEWNYSRLGSKWRGSDLVELIKDEICTTLSKKLEVTEVKFLEQYYYEIIFMTNKVTEEDRFFLAAFEGSEVEIPLSIWSGLKDSIIKLSNKFGANTAESDCEFSYNLNHEYHDIIESWSGELELDKLKDDKAIYKVENLND